MRLVDARGEVVRGTGWRPEDDLVAGPSRADEELVGGPMEPDREPVGATRRGDGSTRVGQRIHELSSLADLDRADLDEVAREGRLGDLDAVA